MGWNKNIVADSRPLAEGDSLMNNIYGFPSRVVTLGIIAFSLVIGTGASAEATSITWNFTESGGKEAYGNSRSDSQNGITVRATALGYTADHRGGRDHGFQTAALGQWMTGRSHDHQVDNRGANHQSVRIDPYGTWDTDVSNWVGNAPSSSNLSHKTYGDLAGWGFSSRINHNGPYTSTAQHVGINSPPANTLHFGAKLGGDPFSSKHHIDRFEIPSVSANVPEPSSLILIGIGIAGLVFWHRRCVGVLNQSVKSSTHTVR
ncbi:MAG: PEP-CTERM sorting domain-containing protein [Nitrospirae bacterium]|nr:PEP-CTERM sorting domain-containing protein [Nitrospirota bacterium]